MTDAAARQPVQAGQRVRFAAAYRDESRPDLQWFATHPEKAGRVRLAARLLGHPLPLVQTVPRYMLDLEPPAPTHPETIPPP